MATNKSEGALLTIGEVARRTGIATHVLRYWEARGMKLRPVKRAGGRRLYRPEDVAMIERLQHLTQTEGYTLDGAMRALADGAAPRPAPQPMAAMMQAGDGAPVASLAALRTLRDRLARALAA